MDLGWLLEMGRGVLEDEEEAVRLYDLAAKRWRLVNAAELFARGSGSKEFRS
jgi:TPR repeat protein